MNIVQHLRPLGVVVAGIDCSCVDVFEARMIKLALARYGMVIFRGQLLSDAQLAAFAGRLGELWQPAELSSGTGGVCNVASFTRSGQRRQRVRPRRNSATTLNPPSLSALYCVIPANLGGATGFASTRIADLGLSAELAVSLNGQQLTYTSEAEGAYVPAASIAHPLIQQNPVTGQKSLYIRNHSADFIALDSADGRALKQALLKRLRSPNNVYRHSWQAGDLILCDNTQVNYRREVSVGWHWLKSATVYATSDYFSVPEGHRIERHPEVNCGQQRA